MTTLAALVYAGAVGSDISSISSWFEDRAAALVRDDGIARRAERAGGRHRTWSSVALLGERPTLAEVAGFALILSASACALLAPAR